MKRMEYATNNDMNIGISGGTIRMKNATSG